MHPLVRDLYKRILHTGKDYPLGLAYVKDKTRSLTRPNRHITNEADIKKAVRDGRWWVQEMVGVIQLKKYRTMKHRYYAEDDAAEARMKELDSMQAAGEARE